jgi:hypothetical protein
MKPQRTTSKLLGTERPKENPLGIERPKENQTEPESATPGKKLLATRAI